MENVKISVLMPSLNVVTYISECVKSVLEQTLKDIEIICIDAGSTDGTLEILESFAEKDNRVKIIKSPIKSYGYQMNLGIDVAQGDYIGIVETDDYIASNMYEELYSHVLEGEPDFIKASYTEFGSNEDNRVYNYVCKPVIEEISGKNIDLNKNPQYRLCDVNHIWSCIYKKSFITAEGIRFNETPGASYQDTSFSFLVGCLAKNCIYLSDTYYYYRIDNSGSSVKQSSKINYIVDEFNYIKKTLELKKVDTSDIQKDIDDLKLFLYTWNYFRISSEFRSQFLDRIVDEIIEYKHKYSNYEHSSQVIYELELLSNKDIIKDVSSEKQIIHEAMQKLSDGIKHGKNYIMLGAGTYGRYVIEMQNKFRLSFIKRIADNSASVIGTKLMSYTVESVDEVSKLQGYDWIIAVKKHTQEIIEQLHSLGVSDDHILIINEVLSFSMQCKYLGK